MICGKLACQYHSRTRVRIRRDHMTAQGPLPLAGPAIKVSMNWQESGSLTYASHFYMQYSSGPPSQADLNKLCGDVTSVWTSTMKPLFSPDIVLLSAFATDLSSTTPNTGNANSGQPGTNGVEEVEAGAAIHLKFKTAYKYRGGHPGCFLPPGPSSQVLEPSSWIGTYLTSVVNAFGTITGTIQGDSFATMSNVKQVAISYYSGHIPNTDPSPWAPKNVPAQRAAPQLHPVTVILGTPLIASQRRRRSATGT